jgi:NADH-quinone oxidoreductase subunit G
VGVAEGEPVTVATTGGAVTLPVAVREMPDRVVWLPTNSPGAAVRRDLRAGAGAVVALRPAAVGGDR